MVRYFAHIDLVAKLAYVFGALVVLTFVSMLLLTTLHP